MAARGATAAGVFGSILLVATLAGCLGADEDPGVDVVVAAPFVDPMLLTDGHDHALYEHHQLSWNMQELGWTTVVEGGALAWGEIDIEGDKALVAHAWPTAGIALLDISNTSAPRLLDHRDLGFGYGADVKWSPDGRHAIVAVQTHSQRDLPIDPLAMTAESGVWVLWTTDDGKFQDESFFPLPGAGSHMVFTHRINDRDYVFAVNNLGGVRVFEIGSADTHRLIPIAEYTHMMTPSGLIDITGTHDMTVIDDPVLGRPLIYISAAYTGLVVADVSDPARPVFLGSWKDTSNEWYTHTAQAEVLEDGTRRIVVVPEVFSDAEANLVAPLWVLDGTDLGDIQLLGTWQNPGDHGADLLRYSVHNFQLVQGKILLAHYHGGVWTLGITSDDAGAFQVETLGYHLPANDPGRAMSGIYHGVFHMGDAPTVWDVAVKDGVVWASDVNSGVYALTTPALVVGDAAASSVG